MFTHELLLFWDHCYLMENLQILVETFSILKYKSGIDNYRNRGLKLQKTIILLSFPYLQIKPKILMVTRKLSNSTCRTIHRLSRPRHFLVHDCLPIISTSYVKCHCQNSVTYVPKMSDLGD